MTPTTNSVEPTTSAPDELRRLLDERGESWRKWPDEDSTTWQAYSNPHTATESMDGTLIVTGLTPKQAIAATLGPTVTGETSDGYHTFSELYHHRAVLFSVIVRDHRELAWKSMKHHDGTMYEDMFIVGIDTPKGQATYHYDVDPYWEMFDCMELERAPEWDGHTPEQAIERIATLGDAPRLPYFWTHDGTLHIELPKLPESISVRLPEQRDREVYSARVWQYTLGSGTCHMEPVKDYHVAKYVTSWGCVCSNCKTFHEFTHGETWKYCPTCRAEVVDE